MPPSSNRDKSYRTQHRSCSDTNNHQIHKFRHYVHTINAICILIKEYALNLYFTQRQPCTICCDVSIHPITRFTFKSLSVVSCNNKITQDHIKKSLQPPKLRHFRNGVIKIATMTASSTNPI